MRPELAQASDLLQQNTPESVEKAIALLQNTVYSFSMKVCGHAEDAEDTMQEVLFRSLPHLAKIKEPQALSVWLYTVTRNRCWRMRRRSASAPKQMVALDELMPDEAELGRLLADATQGPESNVVQAEQAQLLHKAVLQIPPPLRMVLVLHDMEELETDQVAAILGLKPGTVRVRLHRARLLVRKQMALLVEKSKERASQTKSLKRPRSKRNGNSRQRPAECQELFANLSDYIDGRVPAPSCDEMQAHIEACPACVAFLHELRSAIDRCRNLELPCDSAVAQRLRTILTQEYLRMLGAGSTNNLHPHVTKPSPRGFHPVKGIKKHGSQGLTSRSS
jgi:RNA polymerase sigma factor, sigma-70 family